MNHQYSNDQPSEILDRMPPQNLEAERGVLGSLLLDPQVIDEVVLLVDSEDFYARSNQVLFGHLLAMHNEGLRVDVTLLVERLKGESDLELIGGLAYLAEVVHSVPTAANATNYAQIVRDKATLRSLIHASTENLREAWDSDVDAAEVGRRAESRLTRIIDRQPGGQDLVDARTAVNHALAKAREAERRKVRLGLATGIPALDCLLGGLHSDELVIIAARPSAGKTALGSQVADKNAGCGIVTLLVSLEMSHAELVTRMVCAKAGVNANLIRTGGFTAAHLACFEEYSHDLAGLPLFIADRPSATVDDVRRMARVVRRRHGLGLLIVDYLQRLTSTDPRAKRHEQVGQMSDALKTLAREMNIPVVCLCQLNREIEKRGSGRPKLSDLRESGNIEQDADVVMLLHRPELLEPDDPDLVGKAELIVAKNRNGPTGIIDLAWRPQFARFDSVSVFDDGYHQQEFT